MTKTLSQVKLALASVSTVIGTAFIFLTAPLSAFAQSNAIFDPARDSIPGLQQAGGERPLRQIIGTVVTAALGFVGLIAVILFIYYGFLFLTAAGKDEQIKNAKKGMMYSIMGIVIILLAYSIVSLIFSAVSTGDTGAGV